jgi:hypothetical protein
VEGAAADGVDLDEAAGRVAGDRVGDRQHGGAERRRVAVVVGRVGRALLRDHLAVARGGEDGDDRPVAAADRLPRRGLEHRDHPFGRHVVRREGPAPRALAQRPHRAGLERHDVLGRLQDLRGDRAPAEPEREPREDGPEPAGFTQRAPQTARDRTERLLADRDAPPMTRRSVSAAGIGTDAGRSIGEDPRRGGRDEAPAETARRSPFMNPAG